MLQYYRFHADMPHPVRAKPVYQQRSSGSGWPEHCPPIRAANAFGWDVISPFRMRFLRDDSGAWTIDEAVEVESDVQFEGGAALHSQINAWFWEKNQQRPHEITDNVYAAIRHQVKVSTYLYLRTEPGWMLWMKGLPRASDERSWSVIESMMETDWYFPAHPWHGVIELPRIEESEVREVVIEAGEPMLRLVPIQRANYTATEMPGEDFGELYESGQHWLAAHGREPQDGEMMITGEYAKQQEMSKFDVVPDDVEKK